MQVSRVVLLFGALLASALSAAHGNQLVVLLPPDGGLSQQQLLLAANLAVATSGLDLAYLPLATESSATLAKVQAYWAANASITSSVLVLGDSFAELLAAGLFDAFHVPVLRIARPSTVAPATAANSFDPTTYFQAALDVFSSLNWDSAILVHTSQYGSVVQDLVSQAAAINVEVKKVFELTADGVERVLFQIDALTTRVAIFIGQPEDITQFIMQIRDIRTQVLWLHPDQLPEFEAVDLSSMDWAASFIRGFFTVAPPFNETRASALKSQLQLAAPTLFNASTDYSLSFAAYDLVTLWVAAIEEVAAASGNVSDWNEVKAAFYGLTSEPSSVVAPAHAFHQTTGARVGSFEIYNWRADYGTRTYDWTKVGEWVGAVTNGGVSSLALNPVDMVFFDGSHNVPPAESVASFTLGMLWPVSNQIQYAETVRMAADHINANGTIVPGAVIRSIQEGGDGSQSAAITSAIYLLSRNTIIILGPNYSSASQAVEYYVGARKVPCISHAATSDKLSDKSIYPTFYRTIVADGYQGNAMAGLVAHYNWTKVCVLHNRDEYASNIANTFVAATASLDMEVTLTSFGSDDLDFADNFNVIKGAKCNVIVALVNIGHLISIVPQAINASLFSVPGITWIFGEAAGSVFESVTQTQMVWNDTYSFEGVFVTTPLDHIPGDPNYAILNAELKNRTNSQDGFITYATFLYDATWMAARALGKIIKSGKNPAAEPQLLLDTLMATEFDGLSGHVKMNKDGDRVGGIYGIFNFQNASGLVLVGQNSGGKTVITGEPIFSDHTTNIPRDPTMPIRTVSYETGAALIAVVSLVMLLMVLSIVPIAVSWTNPLIRRSSPFFLVGILLGLMLELVSVYFWLGIPEPVHCHLRVWLGFFGVAVAYGALLIKNARLYYLFNEPSLRVMAITNKQLLTYLILVLSPLVILLVLWSALAPFEVVLQLTQSGAESFMICTSPNDKIFAGILFGYIGVAYVVGAILSFKTRNLPDTFKESWYIALATYNLLVITTICIVIGYVLNYDAVGFTVIICVGLILGGLATWALIFVPKFYALIYRKQEINDMSKTKRTPSTSATAGHSVVSAAHHSVTASTHQSEQGKGSKSNSKNSHESSTKMDKVRSEHEDESTSEGESSASSS